MEHKKVVVFGHDSDKKTAVTRAVGCGHTVTVYWRKKTAFSNKCHAPYFDLFFFLRFKDCYNLNSCTKSFSLVRHREMI